MLDTKGRVRAESEATFTVLGEAQVKQAVGIDQRDDLDPSLHLG